MSFRGAPMRVEQLLAQAQKKNLRTEMEVFLCHLLACERLDLVAHGEREVPVERLAELQSGWVKLLEGYPVAYLVGKREFYGRDFLVDERVLIPRDATEELVDHVLAVSPKSVLEVGTGSGAIAVTLKCERPEMRVMAGEVSADALEVARKNARALGADVEFAKSDLLASLPRSEFDVLVANLPYIGEETNRFVAEDVEAFEPGLALFGGHDGLRLYERLFREASDWSFGWIMGEVGFTHGPAIRELAQELLAEYEFELKQDLEGLDRHFILKKGSQSS